jgi:hypothetical protein
MLLFRSAILQVAKSYMPNLGGELLERVDAQIARGMEMYDQLEEAGVKTPYLEYFTSPVKVDTTGIVDRMLVQSKGIEP